MCTFSCFIRGIATIAIATIWVAAPTLAEVVELGVATQYVYNSNYFATANDEEAANSFLIGPTFTVSDDEGRFVHELNYNGLYQFYVDQSGVDAWESRLRAEAAYQFTTRTSIQLTERFRDVSNLRFSRQDIALADTALDPNQDRYFRNDVQLELIHELTRLIEIRLRTAHHWIDFRENENRNDSTAYEGGAEVRYQATAEHAFGVGGTYIYQDFQEALSRLGSVGQSVNAYVSWRWDISDRIVFSASGGPSWIESDEDSTTSVQQNRFVGGESGGQLFRADVNSCGTPSVASNCDLVNPPGIPSGDLGPVESFALVTGQRVDEADELTFFGGASLLAGVGDWNVEAIYSRRQSTTSGDGLTSSLDTVSLELEWAPPNLRWSAFVSGVFNRRETLTEATVVDYVVVDGDPLDPQNNPAQRLTAFTSIQNNQSRRDNYTAIVGVRTALTRNQAATFEFRYRRTEGNDRGISRPSIDTYFLVATFDYTLDPFRF